MAKLSLEVKIPEQIHAYSWTVPDEVFEGASGKFLNTLIEAEKAMMLYRIRLAYLDYEELKFTKTDG